MRGCSGARPIGVCGCPPSTPTTCATCTSCGRCWRPRRRPGWRGTPRLTPVRAELDRLASLDEDAGWGAVQEAHLAFHRALVDAAGSPRLSRAYAQLWSEASLGLVAARNHPTSARRGQVASHRALLATVAKGPPEVAGAAAREHLTIGLGTALAAAGEGA